MKHSGIAILAIASMGVPVRPACRAPSCRRYWRNRFVKRFFVFANMGVATFRTYATSHLLYLRLRKSIDNIISSNWPFFTSFRNIVPRQCRFVNGDRYLYSC